MRGREPKPISAQPRVRRVMAAEVAQDRGGDHGLRLGRREGVLLPGGQVE
jgi:hypothetical protein